MCGSMYRRERGEWSSKKLKCRLAKARKITYEFGVDRRRQPQTMGVGHARGAGGSPVSRPGTERGVVVLYLRVKGGKTTAPKV